jgi:Uma2 family endonuclease
MGLVQEKPYYTYADFLEWDESERSELMDGEIVMMGAPSTEHQRILRKFITILSNFLEGKPCEVFPAPFAVRLHPSPNNRDDTVFEPDIVVVCDPAKIDKKGCNGAPDLVMEIISPSTASYDKVAKLHHYQKAGVREYWIVEPDSKTVQVCLLDGGRYILSSYDDTGKAPVTVLPGCEVDLKAVFAEQAADGEEAAST